MPRRGTRRGHAVPSHYILWLLQRSAISCIYRRNTGREQGRLRTRRSHILCLGGTKKSAARAPSKCKTPARLLRAQRDETRISTISQSAGPRQRGDEICPQFASLATPP